MGLAARQWHQWLGENLPFLCRAMKAAPIFLVSSALVDIICRRRSQLPVRKTKAK